MRVNQLCTELEGLRILAQVKGMNLVTPFGADWGILLQFSTFLVFLNSLHCWKDEVSLSSRKLVVDPKY